MVIVGGGHNGLVAAAYLGRAGLSVLVAERLDHTGGAAISARPWPGVDARLSRYSYLVSLLPDRIVTDLGLAFAARSRRIGSYTPTVRAGRATGLLVGPAAETEASFRALTGSDAEHRRFREFTASLERLAQVVAPTFLEPLPRADELRKALGEDHLWSSVMDEPISALIEATFADDLVRGVVATDALIGTFAPLDSGSLEQNACFLYHVVGNGTGEWRVPVGGMGALSAALHDAARRAGAEIRTNAEVTAIRSDGREAQVDIDGTPIAARFVLANTSTVELARLLGEPAPRTAEGCQLKINLLLDRLPRLRSGAAAQDAFAGTFHLDEDYSQLDAAYRQASAGRLPDVIPAEAYCHTITDPSILGDELRQRGAHSLTIFGLHTPAALFDDDNDTTRDEAVRRVLAQLDRHLEDPIAGCLARDAEGNPCLESSSPLDLEHSLRLPRGNIFHGALTMPLAADGDGPGAWGVETGHGNVFVCGAGARRGGGVSGIGGHNAAHAVLALVQQRSHKQEFS